MREVLYGGAAGGGKSFGVLMAAAQYVDLPNYKALILRRNYKQLAMPDGLMDISFKWWRGTDARWDAQNYTWHFPGGGTITFGYLEHDRDEERYQGPSFHFVAFDELTQFPKEAQYTYLYSRQRRIEGSDIPIRMRATANPGGIGHTWVKNRFSLPGGDAQNQNRMFVASRLEDNPHLDKEESEAALLELSPLTYRQLRGGDWSAGAFGGKFDPAWFQVVDRAPHRDAISQMVRFWDMAATEPNDADPDPDWTAGLKIARTKLGKVDSMIPDFYILDVARDRKDPGATEEFVAAVATLDGLSVPQWFEQERGSAGKSLISHYRRNVLKGHKVRRLWTTGSKGTRASMPAGKARDGRFYIVNGPYVDAFLDETGVFTGEPGGAHDDQVDALSGGFEALRREDRGRGLDSEGNPGRRRVVQR